MSKKIGKNSIKALGRVLSVIKKRGFLVFGTLICAAIYVVASLLIPVFVGEVIDLAVEAGKVDFTAVGICLTKIAVAAGVAGLAQYVMNLLNNRITYGTVADMRRMAFEKIQRLPFSYLDRIPSGDIVSRVTSDAEQVGDGLLTGFTQFFTGVITIIGTLVLMFRSSPWIALAVVVVTPLSLVAARLVSKKSYGFFREQAEVRGEQTAFTNEMISGQKTVQTYSRREKTQAEFDEINGRLKRVSLKAIFWSSLTNPVTRFVNSIVYAVVAAVGAITAISNPAFTAGMLTRMLSYANQYTKPFNEISGVITELQGAMAAAERIFGIIDAEPEISEAPEILETPDGEVRLDHVCFSYVKDKKLIEDLDLEVRPGMKVAIVGPTGCGKTTLINLLMRFYDTDSGTISVDSHPIKDVTRHSLRAAYGMVLQETWLMPGTVRENIAMGKPDATDDEIRAAAVKARADKFIERLPDGYDTQVGIAGMLSEGERQLLCIARVMLTEPPMLILDEATSSIDTRTEAKIKQCFDQMTKGHTSFVVAHRLSTILDADLILVMKDGKVIERGTHEELLAAGGFYSVLWNSGRAVSA